MTKSNRETQSPPDTAAVEQWPNGLRALPHPRLLLASLLVAIVMVPVGFAIAALGVFVLDLSGGAADDTSLVVGVAGFLVADFWGGGLVAALTRARAPQVAAAWGIARLPILLLIALASTKTVPAVPIQILLAVPAAFAGARMSRKQSALRRQIRAEQDAASAAAAAGAGTGTGDELHKG